MSQLDFPDWDADNFSASAKHEGSILTLHLRGSAEMQVVNALESILLRAHEQALLLKVTQIRVNFEQLQFMNSSCFKWFVSWLVRVQDLPAEKPYTVEFVSNTRFKWQRASLRALSCLAPDVVVQDSAPTSSAG